METNMVTGLTAPEVLQRQQQYGRNEIVEHLTPAYKRVLKKFLGPIPVMIEVALLLSAVVGRWEECCIIAVLLLVNVGVDILQEEKAGRALAELKATLARTALVRRDGQYLKIDAGDLVPGDVVKLTIGSIVPADVLLLVGSEIEVDQSALTGESLSVIKKVGDVVYGNAIIRKGEMVAEVQHIGTATYIGRSTKLIQNAIDTEGSHFEKAIVSIGNFLIVFSLVLIVIVVIISLGRGDSIVETIRFALILSIASIPVALPAVLSVTMAVGALAIARKNAIVSNLKAIEELAGVDVLCADKTGTLTQNKMTVDTIKAFNGHTLDLLMTYALLASSEENDDPVEIPLFTYAKTHNYNTTRSDYQTINFVPFDPVRKYTQATIEKDGVVMEVVKGSVQAISALIASVDDQRKLEEKVGLYAETGYRTLVVAAKRDDEAHFTLAGLIPMFDAPREDSSLMIAAIQQAGIRIKMLTGDSLAIAKHIAAILGIGSDVRLAAALRTIDVSSKIESADLVAVNGFAEVFPEDKYHLVEALQNQGHIVAMTGDGVNDAPALKKADIGIAVSGASDAARAASDIVLLAPGLRVINDAIRIARSSFSRMQSYATFRISETIRIVLFMTLSILLFDSYPVTAIMIIMLALLNDIPVMAIAYDNAPVHHKPERWHIKQMLFVAVVLGVSGVISSFLLLSWLLASGFSLAVIQTIIFLKLDVAGHSTLYLTRTGKNHFWHKPFPALKFFIPAFSSRIIGTLIAAFGIFMEPISWYWIALVWIYSTVWWLINDWVKVFAFKLFQILHKDVLPK